MSKRQLPLLLLSFALADLTGGARTPPAPSSPALATRPALTFFSSLSEAPFARLEAEAVEPRFTRHGPFVMPSPGVEIREPRLLLLDLACTPEDWTRFLEAFTPWSRALSGTELLLVLPDNRLCLFLEVPRIEGGALAGRVRPLLPDPGQSTPPGPALLRIAHDGVARLLVELAPPPPAESATGP